MSGTSDCNACLACLFCLFTFVLMTTSWVLPNANKDYLLEQVPLNTTAAGDGAGVITTDKYEWGYTVLVMANVLGGLFCTYQCFYFAYGFNVLDEEPMDCADVANPDSAMFSCCVVPCCCAGVILVCIMWGIAARNAGEVPSWLVPYLIVCSIALCCLVCLLTGPFAWAGFKDTDDDCCWCCDDCDCDDCCAGCSYMILSSVGVDIDVFPFYVCCALALVVSVLGVVALVDNSAVYDKENYRDVGTLLTIIVVVAVVDVVMYCVAGQFLSDEERTFQHSAGGEELAITGAAVFGVQSVLVGFAVYGLFVWADGFDRVGMAAVIIYVIVAACGCLMFCACACDSVNEFALCNNCDDDLICLPCWYLFICAIMCTDDCLECRCSNNCNCDDDCYCANMDGCCEDCCVVRLVGDAERLYSKAEQWDRVAQAV